MSLLEAAPLAGLRDPDGVRAGENFPVALRVLPGRVRRHLHAVYGYARMLDDLGDEPVPGVGRAERLAALDAVEAQVHDLYAGRPVTLAAVARLGPAVVERGLPMAPLLRLIEANRIDQLVTRYDTFERLVDYCTFSADPVGRLVLHVFGTPRPEQVALSDRVCTGLQLVEHLQDVGEDRRRGRVYLPAEDLDRFGVTEADLDAGSAGPALRALVAFEAERAAAWLTSGAPLVATLRGWARLAVSGYLAGGRAALTALARTGHDSLREPPGRSSRLVLAHWVAATVRSAG
ncbi:squalene synthase HpnC [Rhizomonospora bruguierae]|uniref:squalene synthase HpnC n=1 Tax=Rhizomonospora bruguierae TaxID=1581705 RepID=UPI001BCCFBB1|nr:squalene synthase HpnC [Micromonospora sp. NBRC 107566]